MEISLMRFVFFLLAGIGVIFIFSVKYRIPAFYSLMLACLLVGTGLQIPATDLLTGMKDGFGNILKSLGFIIVLGTALGLLLEHTHSSQVMADFILRLVGKKNAVLGISVTGFIIGMPVFCDSGFIVLSGLNHSISKRSGTPLIITSVTLATALLSVHCMIPPHPGASAAAALIGVDFGRLTIAGLAIAVPAMLTGYIWSVYAGKKIPAVSSQEGSEKVTASSDNLPSVFSSFLPVLVPILLISGKSFIAAGTSQQNPALHVLSFLGDPVMALSVGLLLAFSNGNEWTKPDVSRLLNDAIQKAGSILVIIGAGGAFGAVLAAGKIGEQFTQHFPISGFSLLFPFLLTCVLKTAQGSSTVAIITASSIVLPLLPMLGLNSESGRLLCVLSMGAGSMMISQANDAYFWVIAEFSGLEVKPMLKVYSTATLLMGLVSFFCVYLLSFLLK